MSSQSGVSIVWTSEHKRNGRLISRQGTVPSPESLNCVKARFIRKFIRDSLYFLLLINYHKQRVSYCEKNPEKDMPEKYRTGEGFSKSIIGLSRDNLILKIRRIF